MAQQYAHDTSTVTEVLKRRLKANRDGQVLITSRSSERGLGKTTLAIRIARTLDPEWTAEGSAFVNVNDYLTAYHKADPGDILILDEGEHGADSRRSMSKENVDLTQAWATLRYKNVVTLVTLPSTSMLDKRLLELADFRVNVIKRGTALPIQLWVNDFTGKVNQKPITHNGQYELLHFSDLEGDEDFEHIKALKDTEVTSDMVRYTEDEVEREIKKNVKVAEKRVRDWLIGQISLNTDLTQTEISEAIREVGHEIDGMSQPLVSRAVERYKDDCLDE